MDGCLVPHGTYIGAHCSPCMGHAPRRDYNCMAGAAGHSCGRVCCVLRPVAGGTAAAMEAVVRMSSKVCSAHRTCGSQPCCACCGHVVHRSGGSGRGMSTGPQARRWSALHIWDTTSPPGGWSRVAQHHNGMGHGSVYSTADPTGQSGSACCPA